MYLQSNCTTPYLVPKVEIAVAQLTHLLTEKQQKGYMYIQVHVCMEKYGLIEEPLTAAVFKKHGLVEEPFMGAVLESIARCTAFGEVMQLMCGWLE